MDATRIRSDAVPETFDDDRALVTLMLPDGEIFMDGHWQLMILTVDFDELIADVREGRTFVMVSHDLAKGFALCTHALVMARGRIVAFDEKGNLDFEAFSQLYHDTVGMGVA